jgi:hypothetical protein
MKTSELTGADLDWAVNQIEECCDDPCAPLFSTDWLQGGPIIEREGISIWVFDDVTWKAETPFVGVDCVYEGPTPLIAAMRCFVASKLGDEIDIPEDLRILAQAEQLQHVKDLEDFDPMDKFVFDPSQEPMQLRQPQSLDIAEQLTKTK